MERYSWSVGGSTNTRTPLAVSILTGILWLTAALLAAPARAEAAAIDHIEAITDRWLRVWVNSPAMGRVLEVQVLLPEQQDHPRPTVYLLDGRAADPVGNTWITRGDALDFFADKDVNVVLSVGGPVSYYTDWKSADPTLGTYRWETFLTRELPPLLDATFDGSGRNAVAGISMGAQGALMLAARTPGLYAAAAGYSGCYSSATLYGETQMRAVIASEGGDASNMFGPPGDPEWAAHDVFRRADGLRGTAVYLSAGSGLAGEYETLDNPETLESAFLGGPLEAGSALCTRLFGEYLAAQGIPSTVEIHPTGTHSWPYWADELRRSWPVLAGALTDSGS